MANKDSRLTDYLQLGANLGILLGLILVGLQIREASRATTAQLRLDTWYGSMVSHEIMMGEHLADRILALGFVLELRFLGVLRRRFLFLPLCW